MKICTKCHHRREETEFPFKDKQAGKRSTVCGVCQRVYKLEHYYRHRKYYIQKASIWNEKRKDELMAYLLQYLRRHPCVVCGEIDPLVLDFHHRNTKHKVMEVTAMVTRYMHSLKQLKAEIEKCVVYCANCHRRKTAEQFNTRRYRLRSVV